MRDLDFTIDGAVLHKGAALAILTDLEALLVGVADNHAGVRLHGSAALRDLLAGSPALAIAEHYLGAGVQPVRAILFDKSPTSNWALGWHQDRTIALRKRHEVSGYGPWSHKRGVQHVEPPFAIIAAMVTLRIHLDDVPADNAPLLIALGSHRLGKVAAGDAALIAERMGIVACLAERGDIWAYATPILHASERSSDARRRRVLQVDWSATDLAAPLAWLGL